MKKILPFAAAAASAAFALIGCTPSPDPKDANLPERSNPTQKPDKSIAIEIDRFFDDIELDGRFQHGFPGVRRILYPSITGSYTVEYVHTPPFTEKDETLDFSLTLNDDNTYAMTVVSRGVSAEHYGKWYGMNGGITLFYDEPVDPEPHNVYVCDTMYLDIVDGDKLMTYEDGKTIVLSRSAEQLK